MKIELQLNNIENIGELTPKQVQRFKEIFEALIMSGGLTGVKGGKTIIHFDLSGEFQRIQLDYYPWIRKNGIIK